MIYIFDDRAQRRKDNEEKLQCFSDLATFVRVNLIPGKSVEDCIIEPLDNVECILFHKSYALGDDEVSLETIRQMFVDFEIPIVIFSGGTEGGNKSSNEININADLMYNNLPFFLENRKENGYINIDALLWGKKFRLNALLEFQNNIAKRYFITNDPDETIDNPEKIKNYIGRSCPAFDKANLSDTIISTISTSPNMTWGELHNIIDQNIHKIQ